MILICGPRTVDADGCLWVTSKQHTGSARAEPRLGLGTSFMIHLVPLSE
jgi:hypothetical protein